MVWEAEIKTYSFSELKQGDLVLYKPSEGEDKYYWITQAFDNNVCPIGKEAI